MMVRFHRSGAPYTNNKNVVVAQCIVKFVNWDSRKQAHAGKTFAIKNKLPIYISHDLTKRRYQLFKSAQEKCKALNIKDTFAFVDINSNLVARSGRKLEYFNTVDELRDIIFGLSR